MSFSDADQHCWAQDVAGGEPDWLPASNLAGLGGKVTVNPDLTPSDWMDGTMTLEIARLTHPLICSPVLLGDTEHVAPGITVLSGAWLPGRVSRLKRWLERGRSPDLSSIPDLASSYNRSALRFYTLMPPCKILFEINVKN